MGSLASCSDRVSFGLCDRVGTELSIIETVAAIDVLLYVDQLLLNALLFAYHGRVVGAIV